MKNSYKNCLPLLGIAAMAVLLAACSGGPVRTGSSGEDSTTIGVLVQDFSILLDTSEIEAGTITFVVQNDGSIPHDFAIRVNGTEHKTRMIEAGESDILTVDLEPGSYTYICTVPGHEQLGMSGSIAVTSN